MTARVEGEFSTSQDALIEIDGHIPFLRQNTGVLVFFSSEIPNRDTDIPECHHLPTYVCRQLEKFDIAVKSKLGHFGGNLYPDRS